MKQAGFIKKIKFFKRLQQRKTIKQKFNEAKSKSQTFKFFSASDKIARVIFCVDSILFIEVMKGSL